MEQSTDALPAERLCNKAGIVYGVDILFLETCEQLKVMRHPNGNPSCGRHEQVANVLLQRIDALSAGCLCHKPVIVYGVNVLLLEHLHRWHVGQCIVGRESWLPVALLVYGRSREWWCRKRLSIPKCQLTAAWRCYVALNS